MKVPVKRTITATTLAAAVTVALTSILGKIPFAGTISKITFIPNAAITGDSTLARSLTVKNKGLSGIGTTVLATKLFDTGHNASAFVPIDLSLSAVAGALDVAAGDIIAVDSADLSTGLADPGGHWTIEITRDDA
jgi:Zn-dependent alcohol dehydrogenase